MQDIPHQTNTNHSSDLCYTKYLTHLLIKHHMRSGEKVYIPPEALMRLFIHWPPCVVFLESGLRPADTQPR